MSEPSVQRNRNRVVHVSAHAFFQSELSREGLRRLSCGRTFDHPANQVEKFLPISSDKLSKLVEKSVCGNVTRGSAARKRCRERNRKRPKFRFGIGMRNPCRGANQLAHLLQIASKACANHRTAHCGAVSGGENSAAGAAEAQP